MPATYWLSAAGRLQARVNRTIVVAPHEVVTVTIQGRFDVPCYRVESAAISVPVEGRLEVVVERVQISLTTTVLIDDVRLEEVREE